MASPPRSTTEMRTEYAAACCDTSEMVRVAFPGPNGPTQWQLLVETHTAPAWEVFAQVMTDHGYLFRESAGGTYNCRQISGSDSYSLHAYGLAVDLNPSKNGPQGSSNCDQPDAFRADLKAIATVSGRLVFAWGGDWSSSSQDPMHWQVGATKSEIATGIIDPGKDPDDMPLTEGEMKEIARLVWQYEGQFAKDDKDDTAQKTLVRLEGKVDTLEGKVDRLLDG